MKNAIWIVLSLGFIPGIAFSEPVKIFLLLGQSNMNGRGRPEVLKEKLSKDLPDRYPPALSEIRDDVWVTGANGNGLSRQMKNVRLEPGFGQFKYFGPELGFGHVMGDHFKEPVLLMKHIAGGTPLATYWTSPSAAKRTGRQGPLTGRRGGMQLTYEKLMKTLKTLPDLIEGHQARDGYQIMGIVWVHGNADGGKFSKEYEDNLVDFMTDLRTMLGLPKLPFVAVESLSSRAPGRAFAKAVDRVNQRDGNQQAVAILAKSSIDLKGDPAYSAYNAAGDTAHWRHNARAY
ncbi:MAG: sialate O-acetylesterase [Verrucomicrobiota bacterium]